ncbi:MAG: hypothetical protein KF773_18255 [Deltaproteobacteria bacterium]|nr:hypothetical protein [Deltaproteobacteria bacterium]MCW5804178.1 hypothetical protein [Deltaproteobacteria bacterium]
MQSINRLLVMAPQSGDRGWIDDELAGQPLTKRFVRTVRDVVRVLIEEEPPRPQILIIDVDSVPAADVLHLHELRDRGWFGSIIGLGAVSTELCASLVIERVIPRPLGPGALKKAVAQVGLDRATTRMPRLPRTA